MSLVLALGGGGTFSAAKRLGALVGAQVDRVDMRNFPDGESLVRVPRCAKTTMLYGSLDHPDEKLVRLLFAAAALRDLGAKRLVLVAPYLCYMRQDMAFHEGEAVSQRIIGRVLAERFDRVITVDPHLHRVAKLSAVFPGIEADTLTAAPLLAEALARDDGPPPLLIGPDAESRQWVDEVARRQGLVTMLAEKIRLGDRDVRIDLPAADRIKGRRVVMVDDVISSGATMIALARILKRAGAASVEVMATHNLSTREAADALRGTGVVRMRFTDSISRGDDVEDAIALAPLLAESLAKEMR